MVSICSSQLTRYNRMDAGFHLAIQSIQQAMADNNHIDLAVWVPRMKLLPLHAFEPLKPLMRGARRLDTENAHRAIDEYPLEAYCLIRQGWADAKAEWMRRIEDAQKDGAAIDWFA